ncbi:MAG: hypothetical protein QOG39_213 [Acidimicrobiaceae bacterium]
MKVRNIKRVAVSVAALAAGWISLGAPIIFW